MKRLFLLILVMILLIGCGGTLTNPTVPAPTTVTNNQAPTTIQMVATPTLAPVVISPPAQPTNQPAQPTSAAGEQVIEWQNLTIPISNGYVWNETINAGSIAPLYYNLPVVAIGAIEAPPPSEPHVERLNPTSFTLMDTSITLDQWLELEATDKASLAGNTVNPDTLQRLTVAGKPAIRYQRMVIGVANMGFGVVKIADNRLLFVTSDDMAYIDHLFATMTIR